REGLPLPRRARRLRRARDRAPLHPPLLALDERQSRGADQDAATRVGVPLRLPLKRPPQPHAPRLPQVVQPQATPRLTRRPPTNQPRLTRLWSLHLARGARSSAHGALS